jgi:phosphohistidine phosphatase
MKRKLFILRHALPENYVSSGSDHSRKLTDRGRLQSETVGRKLNGKYSFNKVISSDAARAKETAEIVCEILGVDHSLDPKLYSSSPRQIKNAISRVSEDVSNLMIIGHNPTFSELSTQLSATPVGLSQAFCAVLECELEDWSLVDTVQWELLEILDPN